MNAVVVVKTHKYVMQINNGMPIYVDVNAEIHSQLVFHLKRGGMKIDVK